MQKTYERLTGQTKSLGQQLRHLREQHIHLVATSNQLSHEHEVSASRAASKGKRPHSLAACSASASLHEPHRRQLLGQLGDVEQETRQCLIDANHLHDAQFAKAALLIQKYNSAHLKTASHFSAHLFSIF